MSSRCGPEKSIEKETNKVCPNYDPARKFNKTGTYTSSVTPRVYFPQLAFFFLFKFLQYTPKIRSQR